MYSSEIWSIVSTYGPGIANNAVFIESGLFIKVKIILNTSCSLYREVTFNTMWSLSLDKFHFIHTVSIFALVIYYLIVHLVRLRKRLKVVLTS